MLARVHKRTMPQQPTIHLGLFRALIPSWRFFDAEGPKLRLWLRSGPEDSPTPWQEIAFAADRSFVGLLWNPRTNHELALLTTLEEAVTRDNPEVACAVIRNWCEELLRDSARFQTPPSTYQYKILGEETGLPSEPYLLSPWIAR